MFKKAERKSVKLRIAITGSSGAGKTYSALRLAKGIGGKVAVIDSENGSASLYCDLFDFDVMEISAPFTTEKYISAIDSAIKAKYDVLIIDSITHQWATLLDEKDTIDRQGGNSYTNWNKATKKHDLFKAAMLQGDIHVIATMRSKQDYVLEVNEKGKQVPRKVGLAPQQRDGMDYEFTTVFDISTAHEASTSKDRTGLFTDKIFKVTESTGEEIKNWLLTMPSVVTEEEKILSIQKPLDLALIKEEMLKLTKVYGQDPKTENGINNLKAIRACIFSSNPTRKNIKDVVKFCFDDVLGEINETPEKQVS